MACGDSLHPEEKHVDPTIGLARGPQGPGHPPFKLVDAPRFSPGSHALFQLLQDAPGDAGIGVGGGRLNLRHGLGLPIRAAGHAAHDPCRPGEGGEGGGQGAEDRGGAGAGEVSADT